MRCLGTHVGCYATAHTCFMLRNCMCSYCSYHAGMGWGVGVVACVVLTHRLDATQLHIYTCCICYATVCAHSGCMRCLDTHVGCYTTARIIYICCICYATVCARSGCMRCLDTHVGCYATAHTCCMLRNCMCSYCSYHARMGRMIDRHSSARQSLVAFEKKCAKKPVQ